MLKLALIFISLSYFVSCKNVETVKYKRIIIENSPAILLTGLPDMTVLNARNTLSKKYGFHYEWAGGCVIEKKLRDSIDSLNGLVYKTIETKNGKDWKSKYFTELDKYLDLQYKIEQSFYLSSEIKKKNSELFKDDAFVSFILDTISKNKNLIVNACGSVKIGDKYKRAVYYTVTVDSSSMKILNIY